METSVVTSKGQVLIPARLRRKHGIKAGEKIVFMEMDGELVLRPLSREFFRQFVGMFGEESSAVEILMAERKADRQREDRRAR